MTANMAPATRDRAQSRHLATVVGNIDRLSQTLRDLADSCSNEKVDAWSRAARVRVLAATLNLDGAEVTADDVVTVGDVMHAPAMPPAGTVVPRPAQRSTWVDVLKVRSPASLAAQPLTDQLDVDGAEPDSAEQTVVAPFDAHLDPIMRTREIEGVIRAYAAHDLAGQFASDPTGTLAELSGRLTAGLVATERLGALRDVDQAVHDASTGRILYFVAPPTTIAAEMDALTSRWTDDVHPVIVAGLVHLDILRIHPFDAANGRLARATTALMLRDSGIDPHALIVVDESLADTPLDYHEQVAAAARRPDPTDWLCWWSEAVEQALVDAIERVEEHPSNRDRPDTGNDHDNAALDAWLVERDADGSPFTVKEASEDCAISIEQARDRLNTAVMLGRVRRVRGTFGLRFR